MTKTDPITLAVLRNRLMSINDEQGRIASRLSGSPVVYEAKDFNSALLTPQGDSLFIGIYMTRLSLCLSAAVKTVIQRFGDSVGFKDGDAWVTNDPWAGAVHMNDILMLAPIFHGETLVAWTGLAMHEVDVGGPNPGSFTVGTPDVYGEAPLLPPMKLIDSGKIRPDVEAMISRNSRTSALNALDIRARIAAINRTRQRISEVITEYGIDALMEAQHHVVSLTGASFARRLSMLPDGKWASQAFIDHDGNENRFYRIKLAMTKSGDKLRFDFTGTSPQARGAINCTRVGLDSGVFSAILPMLCYDIPWSPAGLAAYVEIISEEGTINNARHPAAVSMATVQATFATSHCTYAAIAKMIACSDLRDEIQANWAPAWHGMTMGGRHSDGRPFTAVLLDATGGSGARARRDGIDAGGLAGAPAMAIGNVETYEKENPILYVWRNIATDTGGHGRTRGGNGMSSLIVPHGVDGPIDLTALSHGVSQPESPGLFGGAPSSVQVRQVFRTAGLVERFATGGIPDGPADIAAQRIDTLPAKHRTMLQPGDALLTVCAGGAGYGDPLEREPAQVAEDTAADCISRRIAAEIYGVALATSDGSTSVDEVATAELRASIRAQRLAQSKPVSAIVRAVGDKLAPVHALIGEALKLVSLGGQRWLTCRRCDQPMSEADRDPKHGALWREVPMEAYSDWNRFGAQSEVCVREFCCPSCAHLIGVQVALKGDPILFDLQLSPEAGDPRLASAAE